MDCILNIIEITIKILTVIGGILALYIYARLTAKMELRIIPEWVDKKNGKVIFHIEIENKAHVWARIEATRLQIFEHNMSESMLDEWVSFSEDYYQKHEKNLNINWKEPDNICTTTTHIYPKAILHVDRLYSCPEDKFLHVGLQIEVRRRFLFKTFRKKTKRWTTTKIIYPPVQDKV